MRIVRAMAIAFCVYSQIPMPQFRWKDEEMKDMLCFFPWIGFIIGSCVYLWGIFCEKYTIGQLAYTFIGTAIPLFFTGGLHADGFMDTMDAFCSYQSREKKLEILKDPHPGAFAVIRSGVFGLFYMAFFSQINGMDILQTACAGFFLSRCLGGISVVSFPAAKKEGLLYTFAQKAERGRVRRSLCLQGLLCMLFMLWSSLLAGILTILTALLIFVYYYHRSKKELGGVTGDTCGYFVLLCESGIMAAAALTDSLWIG